LRAIAVAPPADRSWAEGGSAPMQMFLINNSATPDQLVKVSSDRSASVQVVARGGVQASPSSGGQQSQSIEVPGRRVREHRVRPGQPAGGPYRVDREPVPGSNDHVTFQFAKAGLVTTRGPGTPHQPALESADHQPDADRRLSPGPLLRPPWGFGAKSVGPGTYVACVTRAATRPPASTFRCVECGATAIRWVGRCSECQAWGTLIEGGVGAAVRSVRPGPVSGPAQPIGDHDPERGPGAAHRHRRA
jgi:hypothetical protein